MTFTVYDLESKNNHFAFCLHRGRIIFHGKRYRSAIGSTVLVPQWDLGSTFCLISFLSPRNRVGGDIVTRSFVGGWVSEWVSGCVRAYVRGSVRLYLVDTIATTVFSWSLSNFTCTFAMMRGGTLSILGHGVKVQGQLWHSVHKTLWTR